MSSWKDVPPEVLGLVLNKLHLTHQCYFRAVCKNWRLSQDHIKPCSDSPWLTQTRILVLPSGAPHTLNSQLVDPYSRKSHEYKNIIYRDIITNTKRKRWEPDYDTCRSLVYDTKNGWSLVGYQIHGLSLFLQNNFSNKLIVLPLLLNPGYYYESNIFAVFTNISATNSCFDCEVLVIWHCHGTFPLPPQLYIYRYRLSSGDKEWTTQLVVTTDLYCDCIMQSMDGKLYCLFYEGFESQCALKCYSLADNTCESLSDNVPMYDEELQRYLSWGDEGRYKQTWLTEMEGSLIMVCKVSNERNMNFIKEDWVIFRFDKLHIRWISVKELKNTVFFMSRDKIICHAPLENDNDDCLILHNGVYCRGLGNCRRGWKCYSFKQRNHVAVPEPYSWMFIDPFSFVQPPTYCVAK